jgi:glutathione S-transferase
MMKLMSSPLSPYGRKVKMTALIKGVDGQIDAQLADTNQPKNDALRRQNPLSKIPVLVLENGQNIYDSHVICEYLDSLAPSPVLFPKSGSERWTALTNGALGDGMIDAAILMVYEARFRPEGIRHQPWLDRQQSKIDGALEALEANPPAFNGTPDYGTIAIAVALGYLDFRHEGKWRAKHPKLVAWLDKFAAAVPAFEKTRPVA